MNKIKEFMNDYDVEVGYSSFVSDKDPAEFDDKKWQLATGKAYNLYKTMKDEDAATEDALFSAWCYLKLCVDAKKHNLDYNKAALYFGIKQLEKEFVGK